MPRAPVQDAKKAARLYPDEPYSMYVERARHDMEELAQEETVGEASTIVRNAFINLNDVQEMLTSGLHDPENHRQEIHDKLFEASRQIKQLDEMIQNNKQLFEPYVNQDVDISKLSQETGIREPYLSGIQRGKGMPTQKEKERINIALEEMD